MCDTVPPCTPVSYVAMMQPNTILFPRWPCVHMSLLNESNKETSIDSGHCRLTQRSAAHTKAWPQFHFSHKASRSTVTLIWDICELCEMVSYWSLREEPQPRSRECLKIYVILTWFVISCLILWSCCPLCSLCSSWLPTTPVSHRRPPATWNVPSVSTCTSSPR